MTTKTDIMNSPVSAKAKSLAYSMLEIAEDGIVSKTNQELSKIVPCHPHNVNIYIAELVTAGILSACQDKKGGRGKCNTYSFLHKQTTCFAGNFAECQLGCLKTNVEHVPLAKKVSDSRTFSKETTVDYVPLVGNLLDSRTFTEESTVIHVPFVSTMLAPAENTVYSITTTREELKREEIKDSDKNKGLTPKRRPASLFLSDSPTDKDKPVAIATLAEDYELAKVIARFMATKPNSKTKISKAELKAITEPLTIMSGPRQGEIVSSLVDAYKLYKASFDKFITPAILGQELANKKMWINWKNVTRELANAWKSGAIFWKTSTTMQTAKVQKPAPESLVAIYEPREKSLIAEVLESIANGNS